MVSNVTNIVYCGTDCIDALISNLTSKIGIERPERDETILMCVHSVPPELLVATHQRSCGCFKNWNSSLQPPQPHLRSGKYVDLISSSTSATRLSPAVPKSSPHWTLDDIGCPAIKLITSKSTLTIPHHTYRNAWILVTTATTTLLTQRNR